MRVFVYPLNSCGMRNTVIQSYRDFLAANGHEVAGELTGSQAVLVWTCGFRGDVRDTSLAEIERLGREYPGEVMVAGCLPDIDRELLASRFTGRVIPWRNDREALPETFGAPHAGLGEIPLALSRPQIYSDEQAYRRANPEADVPYIGRYIQLYISEGCPWECTYCSERLAFPPYRSFDEGQILEACQAEVDRSGCAAVVLLGDSVGDYGSDTGSSLPQLVRRLQARIPGIRLALQDVNPHHFLRFEEEMTEFIRSGLIVHLQIPFQAASDRILGLMKRPYRRAELCRVFGRLNALGFREFDSHLIVGFPSETEADFECSVEFARQHHPKYMLINGFMESPGMEAAKLPGKVEPAVRQRRMAEATARLTACGIICNSDDSDNATARFRRMTQIASAQEPAVEEG